MRTIRQTQTKEAADAHCRERRGEPSGGERVCLLISRAALILLLFGALQGKRRQPMSSSFSSPSIPGHRWVLLGRACSASACNTVSNPSNRFLRESEANTRFAPGHPPALRHERRPALVCVELFFMIAS